jgi:hypothetical protein
MVSKVEKAIRDSGLGINPQTNGTIIMLPIPELNEERRRDLSKVAATYAESARVSVRNLRRDGMDQIKRARTGSLSEDDAKFWEGEVQETRPTATSSRSTRLSRPSRPRSCRSDSEPLRPESLRQTPAPRPPGRPRHVASSWTATAAGRRCAGRPLLGHHAGAPRARDRGGLSRDVSSTSPSSPSRPRTGAAPAEVAGLMSLFRRYIRARRRTCTRGIRCASSATASARRQARSPSWTSWSS